MSIMTQLSLIAARYVAGSGGERAVDFLVERFSDQSQRLPKAIHYATERAWKTLELVLAGDSLWSKLSTRAEDQALAHELRQALVVVQVDGSVGNQNEFFRAALKEMRAVRRSPVPVDELQRHTRALTNYADPAALIEAEWHAAAAMADVCERSGHPNLAAFLRLRAGELPLLTVAVRYYFRRAVEEDRELFQGLSFAKLEAVSTAQDRQFAMLAETLDRHAARLDGMLDDVLEDVGYIRENMASRADVARIEGMLLQILAQLGMAKVREMSSRHSMSIRTDNDRRAADAAIRDYRALPEAVRRANPQLIESAAKVQFALGDFGEAQASFLELPDLLEDNHAKAQAHYNAYLAALELGSKPGNSEIWSTALRELLEAAKLNPQRYVPFDLGKYEPVRILGVGGFGVTFLCRNRTTGGYRVIKTLHAEQLDDFRRQCVLDEGRILEHVQHPNIVRIYDIEFAAQPDQRPYFVMEFCDGFQTLEEYVAKYGKLGQADVCEIARQIAAGLKAAHDKGVLHRDIKPANVLVRREGKVWQVRLIDFGLALRGDLLQFGHQSRAKDSASILNREIAGTRAYAPPEQMDEERQTEIGTHSDIYSLGKTCYFMLFLKPDPDDDEKQSLPTRLRAFLSRCTAGTISKRPNDADELVKEMLTPDVSTLALKVSSFLSVAFACFKILALKVASFASIAFAYLKPLSLKATGFVSVAFAYLKRLVVKITGNIFNTVASKLTSLSFKTMALKIAHAVCIISDTLITRFLRILKPLFAAIISLLLPGVCQLIFGQLVKGIIFLIFGLLFLLDWWHHVAYGAVILVGILVAIGGGGPAGLLILPLVVLSLGVCALVESESRRITLHVAGIIIPFLLLPAVIDCPWPTLYLGWVLAAAADAAFTAVRNDLEDTSDWTIFGLDSTKMEALSVVVNFLMCSAAVLMGLYLSHAIFGHLYKHQERIVGIWDLDNKMSVEFTTNGSVLIHSKNNSQVQAKFRWSDRNNTLVIRSSGSFMDSQTVRYTVEFLSQNEMVLVLQERRMFDGHGSDQFLNIAGKLIRTGTPPTNRTVTQPNPATNESKAQPNPVLLGRWVKTDFRNNANQMESILLTARTLSYSKPKMRGHGMYQYTTQLTWVSDTKAMLEVVDVTLQFNIVSDHAIIVSSRNVGFSNFEGIDGHYLRADR